MPIPMKMAVKMNITSGTGNENRIDNRAGNNNGT